MATTTGSGSGLRLEGIKARQQQVWGTGDYSVIGTALQIVGELLAEAVPIRGGDRVLDVATGNGNAALAAARRSAVVTGVDYVPALLDHARERAVADGLALELVEGDAEDLPFPDGAFDVALSTFGVMFTPDQLRAAGEMVRVTRPGGRIGVASWTPDGFIGQLFKVVGKYAPPPPLPHPPSAWGTEARIRELFGDAAASIQAQRRAFIFRATSVDAWIDRFRTFYGPVRTAFEKLDTAGQTAFAADIAALLRDWNQTDDGTVFVASDYLEAVIAKR